MTHSRPHFKTLEEVVGKTPLVALQRLESDSLKANDSVVLGKLEGNNPAGSVKDPVSYTHLTLPTILRV